MEIKDRIVGFERIRAGDLVANPKNWRVHPKHQSDAVKGLLAEIGYADALTVIPYGHQYMLLDGHLRAELTPDVEVPCIILDLNEEEAEKWMLGKDSSTGLADMNRTQVLQLLDRVKTQDAGIQALLDSMRAEAEGFNFDFGYSPGVAEGSQFRRIELQLTDAQFELVKGCLDAVIESGGAEYPGNPHKLSNALHRVCVNAGS